jgi:hypothetical protein
MQSDQNSHSCRIELRILLSSFSWGNKICNPRPWAGTHVTRAGVYISDDTIPICKKLDRFLPNLTDIDALGRQFYRIGDRVKGICYSTHP